MTATTPKRPPMLTATCLYLGLFALIQAISAVDLVTTWNGENGADRVSAILKALRESGASASGAESGYKVFLTVLAVLAAAGVVFAIYTARGDRASRIGLTVVMILVGLSFFFGATGGSFFDILLGAMSVAFTTRLWRGEAKTWFRRLNGEEIEPERAAVPVAAASSPPMPAAQQSAAPQPPFQPQPPYQPQPPSLVGGREVLPKPVRIATWTTFIGSVAVAAMSALALLVLGLVGADDYQRLLRESSLGRSLLDDMSTDFEQLYRTSMVIFGMCLALSLGGLTASTLVLVRRRSGDVFLFVMAAVTVVASILLVPMGIPFTAAAIVVLIQLRKPEARRWFVKT
ncbi:hypothetical protein [Aeromicrobium sp. P5_D10]